MKKTSMITAVALVTSFGLVGCGGGSSSDVAFAADTGVSDTTVATSTVSGKAIDPELVGATVCLDLNRDGICNENEPSATTNEDGTYSLNLTNEQLNGEYPLIAVNGTDRESGEDFKGKFFADVDSKSQHITPLTTLAYENMQQYRDRTTTEMQSSKEKLENALGLTHEEMQSNMITSANEGKAAALQVALTLQKSAEAIAPKDTVQFYKDLAHQIDRSDKRDNVRTSILAITPENLKDEVSSLTETILESRLSDAYDLAYEARMRAIELGIDHITMLEMLPDMPEVPETPEVPEIHETTDENPTPLDIPTI